MEISQSLPVAKDAPPSLSVTVQYLGLYLFSHFINIKGYRPRNCLETVLLCICVSNLTPLASKLLEYAVPKCPYTIEIRRSLVPRPL